MQISGTEESSNSPHARSQLILNRGTKQFSEERLDWEQTVLQQLEIPKPETNK